MITKHWAHFLASAGSPIHNKADHIVSLSNQITELQKKIEKIKTESVLEERELMEMVMKDWDSEEIKEAVEKYNTWLN